MTEVGGSSGVEIAELARRNRRFKRVARTGIRPVHRPEDRTGGQYHAENTLWDVAGVAGYLQVPVSAIYKMTARRAAVRIPHIRLGGKLRFRRSDVERWLTLLTVSNLERLAKVRQKVSEVAHGNDSQTTAG